MPNAFMLQNVLSARECTRILTAVEAMGFEPDEPLAGSNSVLAHNFFWLADPEMLGFLFQRCAPHLPHEVRVDDRKEIGHRENGKICVTVIRIHPKSNSKQHFE